MAIDLGTPEGLAEFTRYTKGWSEKAKGEAMKTLRARLEGERRMWYCTRGRVCDGEAHEGFDYPHARGDQWPPRGTDWFVWLIRGGRGSGKTRAGAEYVRRLSEKFERIALIGPTTASVRDVMVEGESGLQAVFMAQGQEIKWEPSKHKITFPSGAVAGTFSGEEPDRLRGPQHAAMWLDEPAHIPLISDVWDMALFGLRLGDRPHVAMTTTPKPTKWLRKMIKDKGTRSTAVSTYANIKNLAPQFAELVLAKYEGTRLGRQELHGEILEDVEGSLWKLEMLQHIAELDFDITKLQRIIVAIDPAGTNNRKSDETGIVVVGKIGQNLYVLEDASGKYSPNGWAEMAIKLYTKWKADAIVAEKNYGGDMVKATIVNVLKEMRTDARILVRTATRSKQLRAEPIVAKYEQKRVYHVGSTLADLETEMTTWVPGEGDSPNRVDALVWAATELVGDAGTFTITSPRGRGNARRAA
jgi:phage terminase large subunit-like protein